MTYTDMTAGTAVVGDLAKNMRGGKEGWINEGSLVKQVFQR